MTIVRFHGGAQAKASPKRSSRAKSGGSEIKQQRAHKPKSAPPQTAAELERFDRKRLLNDLNLSRTEAAKWFDAYQTERAEKRKASRTIKLLTEEVAALNKKIAELQDPNPVTHSRSIDTR